MEKQLSAHAQDFTAPSFRLLDQARSEWRRLTSLTKQLKGCTKKRPSKSFWVSPLYALRYHHCQREEEKQRIKTTFTCVINSSFLFFVIIKDGHLTFDPGSKVVHLLFINYIRKLGSTFLNGFPPPADKSLSMWSSQFVHLTFNALMQTRPRGWICWWISYQDDGETGLHLGDNRVEEGRPVTQLVGNMSTVRIMEKDWEYADKAVQWIYKTAASSHQPFALYLGLNLPNPYKTESLGPTGGGSTFLTSPYWLSKVSSDLITTPKWLPMAAIDTVDYYSTFIKNCSGDFTEDEVRGILAFYYAMCAEADAMLGWPGSVLRETEFLNNIVIIFISFYKMSMFEGSSNVPLLVMGPGLISGLQIAQLVSLVDLFPTMLGKKV
uniref:Arylsulfatase family, member K n=1 Tax=Cynoglossus semilaevis TaxID=244447 RepID=A0A3P8WJ27_CYNSE